MHVFRPRPNKRIYRAFIVLLCVGILYIKMNISIELSYMKSFLYFCTDYANRDISFQIAPPPCTTVIQNLVMRPRVQRTPTLFVCECYAFWAFLFKSLGPIDAIWGHRSSQHWLRQWLVAWRHQAITWTSTDLSSMKPYGIYLRAVSQEMLKFELLAWVW